MSRVEQKELQSRRWFFSLRCAHPCSSSIRLNLDLPDWLKVVIPFLLLSLSLSQQATGAVLVSQEPSKVILYRGWGAGDKPLHPEKKNASDSGKKGGTQPTVSPELLAAIRLECGLQSYDKEESSL